ncbi:GNAT family N-acetyltransferase [Pontibacter burrus]|uniref:GNAT family N-acetyltransferase n=1 Tax=Pontibacter burrus TaxID=2704466 RepID=A0A6B3LUP8_9BACT|nr:GNAT family N-acetyltransferase [Pontibacter burrus]NEM97224.1 GNAT family N-acetyltransferase [Pontibacter burrus]
MPTHILQTERLNLRELTLQDAAFIVELLNSPGWLKYIGDRNIRTRAEAELYLQSGPIKSYRVNGYGLWLVKTKSEGKAIGLCGIIKRDILDHPDIGFAFLPEANGKGYAHEAAAATLAYAQTQLRLPTIEAITLPENDRSIRLLLKIGLNYSRTIIYPDTQEELHLYTT